MVYKVWIVNNITQEDMTISDDLVVSDDLTVKDLIVTGSSTLTGNQTISGTLSVTGLATLTAGIDGKVILASTETIAAGGTSTALSLTKTCHFIDADAGGDIFTLAAGTEGQIMCIVMKSSTGTATITPSALHQWTSITFNAAGDTVILGYIGAKRAILGGNSYAIV